MLKLFLIIFYFNIIAVQSWPFSVDIIKTMEFQLQMSQSNSYMIHLFFFKYI